MDILRVWPIALCVFQIVAYFMIGLFLIFMREFPKQELEGEDKEVQDFSTKVTEQPQVLRQETWQAWAGGIHPGWLLGLRLFAFLYLFGLMIYVYIERGDWIHFFYYYTEWSLFLLIVYFGWGTLVSIVEYTHNFRRNRGIIRDAESGDLQASLLGEERPQDGKAGYLGYTLQLLFQECAIVIMISHLGTPRGLHMITTIAPAVVLTDGVYWSLLYPFFPEDFPHNFSEFNLHALNFVFLFAELFLNSMRFPWFRAAYFFVWSCLYCFFQWSIHAFGLVDAPWPYPFMNIATNYAPLWYLCLGILHISAYAIVAFFNRLKLLFQDADATLSKRQRIWSLVRSLWPGGAADTC